MPYHYKKSKILKFKYSLCRLKVLLLTIYSYSKLLSKIEIYCETQISKTNTLKGTIGELELAGRNETQTFKA
jgi:hypothetical protein